MKKYEFSNKKHRKLRDIHDKKTFYYYYGTKKFKYHRDLCTYHGLVANKQDEFKRILSMKERRSIYLNIKKKSR